MGARDKKARNNVINRLEDLVGADIPRDLLKVAIVAQDNDELTVQLVDSSGDPVNPTSSRLEEALESIGSDELRVQLIDDSGDPIDPASTELEDTLTSVGTDELRVSLQANNAGTIPVEQQSPVSIEDTQGAEVDPLTQEVFASVDNDQLVVTSNDNDQGTLDGVTVPSNGRKEIDLYAEGSNQVRGKVVSSGQYDVELRYLGSRGGDPLFDNPENIIQGQSGGTPTTFTKEAFSPYLRVVIKEQSGSNQTFNASISL